MSKLVLVIGESGHGKSRAISTLDPKSTAIINVVPNKDLSFRGWKSMYTPRDPATKTGNLWNTSNSEKIIAIVEAISKGLPDVKTIVIDDFQYVLSFEFMDRATEKGYNKFTEIAQNALDIFRVAMNCREDLTVFILSHSETIYDADGNSKTKLKTIGKLLDEKITIEGLSSVVLLAKAKRTDDGMKYVFVTNSDGMTTVKSPEGMFETEIPNDLQYVLDKIKEYEN